MNIRIGWPILRLGVPEDFSNAESLTLHISRVNNNVKTFIPDTHMSITGNEVSFIVTSEMQKALTSGEYKATISYRKVSATSPTLWEPYVLDKPCFTLVDSSADLGGTTDGMDVITIELDGEIGLPKEALPGASAYQIAVAHGFEGDEAEWLYSLKKPALDAATAAAIAANAANDAADAADAATSELNTVMQILAQAESGRVQAEQGRVNTESTRQQAEESRRTNEVERNQAETSRGQAESERVQAEQGRSNAEQTREQSESIRANYETARRQSESSRSSAETARTQAEQARAQAEQSRTQAETARAEAESDRETAENTRTEAEQSRETAETARTQAEQSRGTTFTQKIQESEEATTSANAAADLVAETLAGMAGVLAKKADLLNGTVPAEQLPPELIRTTLYLTQVGHRKRRIQDNLGVEDGTMLWTIVSGTEYLASLSDTLGLGLYLVSQDLSTYKKLSKTNSNLYADGTPAKLDGTEGDIQMCWRKPIYIKCYEKQESDGLYEHIEISHLNILGECEMIVPGGGFPAVLNRTTGDLRALYSTDPNYRGGNNTASYDSDPIKTLIGKPATNLSAYSGEFAAKKRGSLWTTGGTPFFATLAILQIMLFGTNNAQDAIVSDDVLIAGEGFQSCKKNASGLYSGGFGVNNSFPQWSAYNAYNPTFDLSAGFSYGDITGRRVYIIKDWPTVGTNQTISLAYFFGMPYPFNHYWHGDAHQRVDQQTEAQGFKTVVYQKRDITAAPISGGPSANGVAPAVPWEKVAEASRTEGYIRRTSFNALCLIPTVAGSPGSSNKFYPDYFYNNGATSFGWRAPIRFAILSSGANAGPFNVNVNDAPTNANAGYGAFCCHFSSGTVPKKITI